MWHNDTWYDYSDVLSDGEMNRIALEVGYYQGGSGADLQRLVQDALEREAAKRIANLAYDLNMSRSVVPQAAGGATSVVGAALNVVGTHAAFLGGSWFGEHVIGPFIDGCIEGWKEECERERVAELAEEAAEKAKRAKEAKDARTREVLGGLLLIAIVAKRAGLLEDARS